ncbi:MAG TPA: NAD(P)/FAD-dependent oxidoreductase [Albitalea sp.]|uniref:NAD(P)/FAD-dependent oxidoreductase n=1 Tax=Piscinibacter sp. TaxID=1903157 RepID=UPI002ED136FE
MEPAAGNGPHDALVIGAGPAGLATAIYLARFLRSVLVVEDGRSRAATIPRSHNYPAFPEGVAGARLVQAMREQATRHGARFAGGRVHAIDRLGDGGFSAQWKGGSASARKLVLATGVSDVAPTMPHLADAMQQGALRFCPVCDGYEVRGQAVGLLADHGSDTFEALYLRHFTDRITLFPVSEEVRFTDVQRRQLADAHVAIAPQAVRAIRLVDGGVTLLHGDRQTRVDSLYCALGMDVHSDLAVALGAEHDDNGYLLADHHQQTTVPGLYAVGDVVKGLNQISVAVGEAAVAAAAIHLALMGKG